MTSLPYTGERTIPWSAVSGRLQCIHTRRYAWAMIHAWGQRVVDLGTGSGYGAFILSWVAESVVGIDNNKDAILWAMEHFRAPNLSFAVYDLELPAVAARDIPRADLYVALEVLEHLQDPKSILETYHPLLWSMPVNDPSRYHTRAYSLKDLDRLFEPYGYAAWFQDQDGTIVSRRRAWFKPSYVLGITHGRIQ